MGTIVTKDNAILCEFEVQPKTYVVAVGNDAAELLGARIHDEDFD